MPSIEPLCNLAGVNPSHLSREENIIIEAEFFARFCENLNQIHKDKYKSYFKLIKFDKDKEIAMIDESFARCIINDILSTEEYTVSGIAYYTQTPEEIVIEIASGNITNPSLVFFRKIVELHRSVRGDLYKAIMEKIISEYSAAHEKEDQH